MTPASDACISSVIDTSEACIAGVIVFSGFFVIASVFVIAGVVVIDGVIDSGKVCFANVVNTGDVIPQRRR